MGDREPTAYPLFWPDGWPRTHDPEWSNFSVTLAKADAGLRRELSLMGASAVVVSTNAVLNRDGAIASRQPRIEDTGVASWFVVGGERKVIACDRWFGLAENVRAVELTVNALRGIARWGTREMLDATFAGFAALPAGGDPEWWTVLGVAPDADPTAVDAAYKRLAMETHPDRGGDAERFLAVTKAFMAAKEGR